MGKGTGASAACREEQRKQSAGSHVSGRALRHACRPPTLASGSAAATRACAAAGTAAGATASSREAGLCAWAGSRGGAHNTAPRRELACALRCAAPASRREPHPAQVHLPPHGTVQGAAQPASCSSLVPPSLLLAPPPPSGPARAAIAASTSPWSCSAPGGRGGGCAARPTWSRARLWPRTRGS